MTLLNIWNLIYVQCDNNLNFIQRTHLKYTKGFKTVPIIDTECVLHIYQNVSVFEAISWDFARGFIRTVECSFVLRVRWHDATLFVYFIHFTVHTVH
jgi:hypothetical protein